LAGRSRTVSDSDAESASSSWLPSESKHEMIATSKSSPPAFTVISPAYGMRTSNSYDSPSYSPEYVLPQMSSPG